MKQSSREAAAWCIIPLAAAVALLFLAGCASDLRRFQGLVTSDLVGQRP